MFSFFLLACSYLSASDKLYGWTGEIERKRSRNLRSVPDLTGSFLLRFYQMHISNRLTIYYVVYLLLLAVNIFFYIRTRVH